MSTLTSLARAQAVEAGRARPICSVRHVHVSARPLVLIPLALAGEACAPLAAMVGDDPARPRVLVVAQPRDRSQRFEFAADLASEVLRHVTRSCRERERVPGGRDREARIRYADATQILAPNRAGIAFLRLLGRSTRFRRTEGEFAVPPPVPLLGRWLTFYAEHAEIPGSSLMLALTDALAMHWATGQSPVEDLNLAAQLGWIDPPDGLTGPQAALAAEDPLQWPPAGPATDPTFDNEVLAPLIRAYDRAAKDGERSAIRQARGDLERALTGQLEPTWRLMWQAVELLLRLPPGERVAMRWDFDKDAFTGYAEYLAEGGLPQARRDSAVAAARRLARLERLVESVAVQRAFDDPLVMAEYRLTGEAFAGRVVAAEPDRLDTSGRRAKLRPHVTVQTPDVVQVGAGAFVASPARPTQEGRVVSVVSVAATDGAPVRPTQEGSVVSVDATDSGPTRVVIELAGGMGRGKTALPGTIPGIGEVVCYATFKDGYQPPPSFPDVEQTPWTHGGPPAPYLPTPEDAQEAWS